MHLEFFKNDFFFIFTNSNIKKKFDLIFVKKKFSKFKIYLIFNIKLILLISVINY